MSFLPVNQTNNISLFLFSFVGFEAEWVRIVYALLQTLLGHKLPHRAIPFRKTGVALIRMLDDGKVESFGTHEELLNKSEIYRDVYESQTKGGKENE